MVNRLSEAASQVGLHINVNKTEVMAIPSDDTTRVTLQGHLLKTVRSFVYLGIDVSDSAKALRARRAKAWGAAKRLHTLFHSDLTVSIKVRIFRATVEQVLLYGSEALTIDRKSVV
jgi:hypothetical protein